MREKVRRLFNLNPGEDRKTAPFLILAFLWSVGSFGTLTLSEGMFLEHVGACRLPLSYLLTAISTIVLSTIFLTLLGRLAISSLLACALIGATALYSFFLFLLFQGHTSSETLWIFFKIIGWVAPVAINVCFWAFIDQYYDLQAAKRLFCLVNAVICLGDACGGALISFALGPLGIKGLIFLFSLSIGCSIPFVFLILRRRRPLGGMASERVVEKRSIGKLALETISSPFTLILMLFYFLMQLLAITTEYSYMDTFAASHEVGELAEFLGTIAMLVSLGNMLFGLFFYSRTVTKIGVNNIILIVPLFFALIFVSWVCKEALPIALFALIAREGMVYTFDDNNLLLLISGVPLKIKNQVRIAIESFFEPIGMLFGASLLFVFQTHSKVLGLLLSILGLVLVLFLRSHYLKAIFHNLLSHSLRFDKKAIERLQSLSKKEQKETESALFLHLKGSHETIKLLSYESLLKTENHKHLPRLLHELGRFSIPGRLRAIELVSESLFAKESVVVEHLERMKKRESHPQVKSALHFYFAKHGLKPTDGSALLKDLDSEHLGVKGAAILSLKATVPMARAHLEALFESKIDRELIMGLKILGLEKSEENIPRFIPYLKHPSNGVTRAAAEAISLSVNNDSTLLGLILPRLPKIRDSQTRLLCLAACEKIKDSTYVQDLILSGCALRGYERKILERIVLSFGGEITFHLLAIVKNESAPIRSRSLAASLLAKLNPPEFRAILHPLVKKEIERAHFYLYHAKTLPEEQSLSILENTLLVKTDESLGFIIDLLGTYGSFEETDILMGALKSKNRKMRADALETIEKMTPPALFTLLKPLLEENTSFYLKLGLAPLNLAALLDTLEHSPSAADRLIANTLKMGLVQ